MCIAAMKTKRDTTNSSVLLQLGWLRVLHRKGRGVFPREESKPATTRASRSVSRVTEASKLLLGRPNQRYSLKWL